MFRWLWRQRIRLHLEGTGINPTPVDLHEQQLSLEQHSQAHRITTMDSRRSMAPLIKLVAFALVEICQLGLDPLLLRSLVVMYLVVDVCVL